jgi:PAS domain S-box-containing protein
MQGPRDSALKVKTPFARTVGEQELKTALDAAGVGVWNWNIVTNEVSWSDNLERIHGLAPGTFGGTFEAYLADIHPDDRDSVLGAIERTVSESAEYDVEYRILPPDGSVRWVGGKGRVFHDASGRPVRMTGTCQDVTRRRSAEEDSAALGREIEGRIEACAAELARASDRLSAEAAARLRAEEQLRHAQRMATIGNLTAAIVHDFNNLLTIISGYSELALPHLKREGPASSKIAEIRKAAARGAALTRRLLVFSRYREPDPKRARRRVDVNATVAETTSMLDRLLGPEVELIFLREPGAAYVRVDAGRIDQVLLNLVLNAYDAMPNGGQIIVETANVEAGEPVRGHGSELAPGRYVTLSVRDTGCGMEPDTLERIFEPFFTTKEHGRGTGLGLSSVYGIVREEGGAVQVTSTPGLGTSFTIFLPRVEAEATGDDADARPARPAGSGRVLVVETNTALRALLRDVLEDAGYEVLEARDGREAAELCGDPTRPLDLLLVGARPPREGAPRLPDVVAEAPPGVRVLVMTDLPIDAGAREFAGAAAVATIEKPFAPDELIQRIQELFGAEGRR